MHPENQEILPAMTMELTYQLVAEPNISNKGFTARSTVATPPGRELAQPLLTREPAQAQSIEAEQYRNAKNAIVHPKREEPRSTAASLRPREESSVNQDSGKTTKLSQVAGQSEAPDAELRAAVPAGENTHNMGTTTQPSQTVIDERQRYLMQIRQRIEQHKRYPGRAVQRKLEGSSGIGFLLAPDGSIGKVEVTESSGHRLLDEAAMAAVNAAAPFPVPPAGLVDHNLKLELKIIFALR